MRRDAVAAVEIDDDDAEWLRSQGLPEGVEIAELDEVEFFGEVYDRAPGGVLSTSRQPTTPPSAQCPGS